MHKYMKESTKLKSIYDCNGALHGNYHEYISEDSGKCCKSFVLFLYQILHEYSLIQSLTRQF